MFTSWLICFLFVVIYLLFLFVVVYLFVFYVYILTYLFSGGASDDFAKAQARIPYAATIELPDEPTGS